MFNFKSFARQACLALALAFAAGASTAGPTYLVTIHTQAYSGESGLLDFGFLGATSATGDPVTVSNFSGAFGDLYDRSGGVSGDLASSVSFSNTGTATYLTQMVNLGDDFTFTLHFGDAAMPADPQQPVGLTFNVALFNSDFREELAQLVLFDLMPSYDGMPASITISANTDLVEVVEAAAVVPEPSQLLLMLSALALAGAALRRRSTL